MNADPALLHRRLLQQPGDFEPLLQRVQRLQALNRLLQGWTSEPWLSAIRIANLRGDTLVIYADNAAAMTSLRYRSESLLDWLKQQGVPVLKLDLRIRPSQQPPESKRRP